MMNSDQVLDELTDIYRDSQIYACKKCCHHEKYPYHEIPCPECQGKMMHVGELGKSIEGSFQWYIARAKGEQV